MYETNSFFIYLRSKMALELDINAQQALNQMRGDANAVLAERPGCRAFTDGLVLNVWTKRDLRELKSAWMQHLGKFESWVIHDGKESIIEGLFDGPACTGLNALTPSSLPLKQVFLVFFRHGDDEPRRLDADALTESIIGALPQPVRSVFYFRNGRILLMRSKDPVSIIMRRLERSFPINVSRDGRGPRRHVHEIGMISPDDVDGRWYYSGNPVWEHRFVPGDNDDAARLRQTNGGVY